MDGSWQRPAIPRFYRMRPEGVEKMHAPDI
jgi:hypothetical protein